MTYYCHIVAKRLEIVVWFKSFKNFSPCPWLIPEFLDKTGALLLAYLVLFVNCELIHEGNWNCFWPPGSMKGQWLLLSLPSSQPANDGWQSYANGQDVWGRRLPYTEWREEPAILMTDKSHGKRSFRSEWNQKGRNKWNGFVQLYSVRNAPPPHCPVLCLSDGWWVHPVQWRHHLKCGRDRLVMLSETDQRPFLLLVTLRIRLSSGY